MFKLAQVLFFSEEEAAASLRAFCPSFHIGFDTQGHPYYATSGFLLLKDITVALASPYAEGVREKRRLRRSISANLQEVGKFLKLKDSKNP